MIITHEEIESFYFEITEYKCILCKLQFPNKGHKLEHLKQCHKFQDIANHLNLTEVEFSK